MKLRPPLSSSRYFGLCRRGVLRLGLHTSQRHPAKGHAPSSEEMELLNAVRDSEKQLRMLYEAFGQVPPATLIDKCEKTIAQPASGSQVSSHSAGSV